MDEQLENRLRFLRKANTEGMPHSDRGLLDHLLGTRQLLVEWEARPALCDAGLFHSVYGTEYYELKAIPLTMRNEMQQLIGEEAESLAWLFCMIRRETLYQNPGRERDFRVEHRLTDEWLPLTKIQFQDLLTLTIANTLEAFPRCSRMERRHLRRYLRRFRDIAIPPVEGFVADFAPVDRDEDDRRLVAAEQDEAVRLQRIGDARREPESAHRAVADGRGGVGGEGGEAKRRGAKRDAAAHNNKADDEQSRRFRCYGSSFRSQTRSMR
jgi:hypothetical protein